MNIFIDIETIPCQLPAIKEQIAAEIKHPSTMSKPETIAKWEADSKTQAIEDAWRRTTLDGGYGQIVCASIAINDDDPLVFYRDQWQGSELTILCELFDAIRNLDGAFANHKFIGHYHTGFDLRFIFQRAVINGIRPPENIPFGANAWDNRVFDTMHEWAGRNERISLDKLCRILGIEGKCELDGSKVWDYVKDGKIKDVAEYCKMDVIRTREVYKRMTFA